LRDTVQPQFEIEHYLELSDDEYQEQPVKVRYSMIADNLQEVALVDELRVFLHAHRKPFLVS
jgi:hypothetical protein